MKLVEARLKRVLPMKRFSELTGKEKLIELLRWLCVPVASVGSVFVVRLMAGLVIRPLVVDPAGFPQSPLFYRLILGQAFGILIAILFVIAGAKLAPRFRATTAWVLAGLWIAQALLIHVLVHLGQGTPHYVHFLIAALPAVAAAAYINYSEKTRTSPTREASSSGE